MPVINGTPGNDGLTGYDGDAVNGLGGDDSIGVYSGAVTIDGGDGFDRINLYFYYNYDSVLDLDLSALWSGGVGTLNGASITNVEGFDFISGGYLSDTIVIGERSTATIHNYFGPFQDLGYGMALFAGNDVATGGSLVDVFLGGFGDDVIDGGGGDDILYGNGESYDESEELGYIPISGPDPITENDTLHGGDGNDHLHGNGQFYYVSPGYGAPDYRFDGGLLNENDLLYGEAGDDWIEGGNGDDLIDGGAGIDTASYELARSGVTVSLLVAGPQNTLGAGIDTLVSIDHLFGSDGHDTLTGNADANILTGGYGNDRLDGGAGADVMVGGFGDDFYVVDSAQDSITELANQGNDTIRAIGMSYTLSANFENLEFSGVNKSGIGNAGANRLTGDAGAQTLSGLDGNDSLDGAAGNDVLVGGNGDDLLIGGDGDDSLRGNDGSDTASWLGAAAGVSVALAVTAAQDTHGAGIDTLSSIENAIGSAFDDVLTGTATANTIEGAGGNDLLDAGGGVDTVSYAGAGAGVTVSLATGSASGGAGNDVLAGFELIIGSAFGDLLAGDGGVNRITGGGGNDAIDGAGGNDMVLGEAGDDVIEGGAGDDAIDGGVGADIAAYVTATAAVVASLVGNTATGGGGSDALTGIEGLTGSAFGDTLTGNDGANALSGGGGADLLAGGLGNDTLVGGTGIDTATYAGIGYNVVVNLTIGTATGGGGSDTLAGIENLIGSAFNDTLTGDSGVNILSGGLGNDMMDGGLGIDTVTYADASGGIRLNLLSTSAQGTVSAGADTLRRIENVVGTAFADQITGSALGNSLTGGDGDDLLDGGLGNDLLIGGAGIDTASYATATGAVKVSLAILTAQSTLAAGSDTLSGIETLIGSAFDDQLTGDGGNNILTGNAGNDILLGAAGNDTLNGGAGIDATSYAGAAAGVTVSLAVTTAQNTGGGGTDTFLSIENLVGSGFADTLTGSSQANSISGGNGDDLIDGGSSNDTIDGGANNDTLKGGNGDDLITGGTGNDSIDGGANIDTISYAAAGNAVTVNLGLATAQAVGGGQGSDTIVNVENIIGSAFGDTLTGSAAANRFTGGAGKDTQTGGAGNDRFVYMAIGDSVAGANADRITDLAAGDILDLSAIDANANTAGTNEAFTKVGAFSGTAGQFTLAFSGGANTTILLADVNGDSVADFSILFTGDVTALSGSWVL